MARDRRERVRRATPPHRPRGPLAYRGATREGTRGWEEEAARFIEAYREIERIGLEEAELRALRALWGLRGAASRWMREYVARAEEARAAGLLEEARELEARAERLRFIEGLARAIEAEIREYGFDGYVLQRAVQAALRRDATVTFPELQLIPGRVGEYLRALAEYAKRLVYAREKGLQDYGVIICDPSQLELVRRLFPSYRFRAYGYREEREEYEWDSKGGKKWRSRGIHTYAGTYRGSDLDYRLITEQARLKSGIEHYCVELIPVG